MMTIKPETATTRPTTNITTLLLGPTAAADTAMVHKMSNLMHRCVCFLPKKWYQPKSKTVTDNTSINVVEEIAADCSPSFIVFDLQSSFAARRSAHQPDI